MSKNKFKTEVEETPEVEERVKEVEEVKEIIKDAVEDQKFKLIHNPSDVDVIYNPSNKATPEIVVLTKDTVRLDAETASFLLKTYGFLKDVTDEVKTNEE